MRVLIAEDEWLLALSLAHDVRACGHEVVGIAHTGAQAVAMAEKLHPDLTLMDIQMPKMDGLAATRLLMANHPHPIVIVTGRAGTREEAEEAGAAGYVVKPLPASRLPEVIAAARLRFEQLQVARARPSDAAKR
jgi:AmiR/NasT family two-component response regulator